MKQPKYPSIYQINTRVWLTSLSSEQGSKITLDEIPDKALDQFAEKGFDWIWFLSVWSTGKKGQHISRKNPEWRKEFEETLPDLKEEDIAGSGFAISDYKVHPDLGGDAALKRLREKLHNRGLKLMLDFVPNHTGPDHPWVRDHPEYFIPGTEDDLKNYPLNFTKVKHKQGDMILAYGRDPYFDGWPDTLQLDYSNPATVEAMTQELLRISSQCDGVRCDMAMVILPEIFETTWGRKAQNFWTNAIRFVKEKNPDFCFLAEVYWDMEWTLQQLGFDYTYDKPLYDRLREGHARSVLEHFYAGLNYQDKMVRFLENHDETRAAATFDQKNHEASAVITYLAPGFRFFHQGQLEGKKIRISPHLVRAPEEPIDEELQTFYNALLSVIRKPLFRNGNWHLLKCDAAWEGNETWDSFLAFEWEGIGNEMTFVIVNYAPYRGQCYVRLPFLKLADKKWRLNDLISGVSYDRDGNDLRKRGLYLDVPEWRYHIFEMKHLSA